MMPTRDATPGPEFVTDCGRRIRVGEFHVGAASGVYARVTLQVGPGRGGVSGAWAGLTASEAKELARCLLERAAEAEAKEAGGRRG